MVLLIFTLLSSQCLDYDHDHAYESSMRTFYHLFNRPQRNSLDRPKVQPIGAQIFGTSLARYSCLYSLSEETFSLDQSI